MRKLVYGLFIFFLLNACDAFSQCAMCRRTVETSQTGNTKKGLNAGIIYLLSIPYMLGGVGVFMWYRNRNRS